MPDFTLEDGANGIVAGIDEVGRGPLAGPVFAAAVILDRRHIDPAVLLAIDDSKRLTMRTRERLFAALQDCAAIGVGQASVAEIDALNILRAAMLAMSRAVAALPVVPEMALVDGNRLPELPCPARAVVDGDRISLSVAAASIIAKVTRDRLMADLGRIFPGYGWERNAGYGTREHLTAVKNLGITPHHRRSFAPINKILCQIGDGARTNSNVIS